VYIISTVGSNQLPCRKWLIESNTPDDDLEIHDDAELPPTAGDMLNNMAENNHESASSSAGEEPAEPQAAST
jgi:hypothetical protein